MALTSRWRSQYRARVVAVRELPIPDPPFIGPNDIKFFLDAILLWLACNHNTPKVRGFCKNRVLLPAGCWFFSPQSMMTAQGKHMVTA
jgi:hypothetical protein